MKITYKITSVIKIVLCIVVYANTVSAQVSQKDVFLTITNANVVDVVHGKIDSGVNVIIKNDRIESLSPSKKNKIKGTVIDAKGQYLLPGLVDSHAHISNIGGSTSERSYEYVYYLLKHGITTFRDPAGYGPVMREVQQNVNTDIKAGADIYFAAFMAGDWYFNRGIKLRKKPYHPWEQILVPGTNLDSAMKAAKAFGATGVKLYHSFDAAFLKQVTKAAKKNNLITWGHAMLYPARPLEVVRAGVEVISHASMLEALINDPKLTMRKTPQEYKDSVLASIDVTELAREMKKRNVILDATVAVAPSKGVYVLVKKLHQQGVKISAGTDVITVLTNPYPHILTELNYFVNDCGFTSAEALKSATLISAETIGEEKNIGSIEKGKKADLILVNQNPLRDINSLKDPFIVVKHGKVVE